MSSPNGRAKTPNQARSRGKLLLFQHPSRPKEEVVVVVVDPAVTAAV
jgi:hypothetical protein